jgi:hypothetical protein
MRKINPSSRLRSRTNEGHRGSQYETAGLVSVSKDLQVPNSSVAKPLFRHSMKLIPQDSYVLKQPPMLSKRNS